MPSLSRPVPLPGDNQWLLDVAATHPIIVGVIGDLIPASPSYLGDLDRLHRESPLPGDSLRESLESRPRNRFAKARFLVEGLKSSGSRLDWCSIPQTPTPISSAPFSTSLSGLPSLRIVIDHLPHSRQCPPNRPHAMSTGRICAASRGIPVSSARDWGNFRAGQWQACNRLPLFYRDSLDAIWDVFGEDRILFGSDWPNSGDHVAPFAGTRSPSSAGTLRQKKTCGPGEVLLEELDCRVPLASPSARPTRVDSKRHDHPRNSRGDNRENQTPKGIWHRDRSCLSP